VSSGPAPAFRVNGDSVAAKHFYEVACDPRRSVVVEACAGAGKTWMLVSRILRALMEDATDGQAACQPHEILAITFTRKAAGEMRERLHQWLNDFAVADDAQLLGALQERGVQGLHDPAMARRCCDRLRGLQAAMLEGGRAVEIRTFHGWFSVLLRSAPVTLLQQLQLPVRHELLDDDSQAKDMAWRQFLSALLVAPQLRSDFEALVRRHGRSQVDKALRAGLDKRIEFERADEGGVLSRSVKRLDEAFVQCLGLRSLADMLERAPEQALLQQAIAVLKALSARKYAALGHDLENALAGRDLDGVIKALLVADSKGVRPRHLGNASSHETLRQAQSLALELLEMQRQEQAWDHHQRMIRLTRLLISQFKAVKLDRGWIDMNDVESAALHLLSDEHLSGWVQERLDAQVRHLLIDEFQDTNPLQWQALRAWLQSYAGAARAISVFIVGDPKQSIYRFRRAEPQVFRAASQFISQALGGDRLSCDHTRRNAPEVMAAVNAVMDDALRLDAYQDFRPHTTASADPGQVWRLPVVARLEKPQAEDGAPPAWRDSLSTPRWLPEEKQRDLEAAQAAAWIARQIAERGLAPKDVMVLSRKRDSLLPMQLALRAHGVAADIGEKTALMDCCEVQDVVALLDALVSPNHNLSLARVLRSPIFGLDSSALVPVALAAKRTGRSWMALLQAPVGSVPEFDNPQASVFPPLGAMLARWQGWVRGMPPHDALQAIYDDGDLLARYVAAAPDLQREPVLVHLRAILSVALGHEGGRYLSAYALVRALKGGRLEAPATVRHDAVRLLTIHGAKGLEADTVLILDADTPPRAAESMGVLVDWPGEQDRPDRFVFLLSESRPQSCVRQALTVEFEARAREELNALYVAMTRARRVLAFSAREPHRATARSWWHRLIEQAQAVSPQDLDAPKRLAAAAEGLAGQAPVVRLPVLPPLAASQQLALTTVEPLSDAARVGLAMHRLLEWGQLGPEQVRAASRQFRLDSVQTQAATEAALQILQGQGAWLWRSEELLWQGSEVELVHEGSLLRLDRLVHRRDGSWWVIDYKSHARPETQAELLLQLRTYAKAVSVLHRGQTVRAAFLTPQGRLIEIDVASS
jgi:ATP-dependent helicase/nuclease subunit A